MNKCRHCGSFVPIEKAFCPNCSEPIEPEEAPARSTTSSSDMMSTMRDDTEHYREMVQELKRKPPAAPASDETAAAHSLSAATPPPQPIQVAANSAMQDVTPLPSVKGSKRGLALVIGMISFLVIVFVILLVFKLI